MPGQDDWCLVCYSTLGVHLTTQRLACAFKKMFRNFGVCNGYARRWAWPRGGATVDNRRRARQKAREIVSRSAWGEERRGSQEPCDTTAVEDIHTLDALATADGGWPPHVPPRLPPHICADDPVPPLVCNVVPRTSATHHHQQPSTPSKTKPPCTQPASFAATPVRGHPPTRLTGYVSTVSLRAGRRVPSVVGETFVQFDVRADGKECWWQWVAHGPPAPPPSARLTPPLKYMSYGCWAACGLEVTSREFTAPGIGSSSNLYIPGQRHKGFEQGVCTLNSRKKPFSPRSSS